MKLAFMAIIFLSLLGCATARVVTTYPGKGGVIALSPKGSSDARKKAEALMTENCSSQGFAIEEEGESVIGSTTRSTASSQGSTAKTSKSKVLGIPVTTTGGGVQFNEESTTKNETEWRIKYKCGHG